MRAENKAPALQALIDMWKPEVMDANGARGGSYGGGQTQRSYSWMHGTSLAAGECNSFEEGMDDWRYPVTTDDEGNVTGISFDGEKIGDEDHLFRAIAPFVTPGSWLEFQGEDGSRWRVTFTGTEVTHSYATISYD